MRRDTNWGLYIGLLLVLIGVLFFLDLNGILPGELFSEYVNLVIGVVLLVGYFRTKSMGVLMPSIFFITNGVLMLCDNYVYGFNYIAGIFLIPGFMLLVAFMARKMIGYLIPGALLVSWGIYVFLISAGVFESFTTMSGMSFIFTAIGFLIIFLYEQKIWAGIPALVIGVIGIIIVTLGFGPEARHILFNVTSIGVIVIGLLLILRSLFKPKHNQGE